MPPATVPEKPKRRPSQRYLDGIEPAAASQMPCPKRASGIVSGSPRKLPAGVAERESGARVALLAGEHQRAVQHGRRADEVALGRLRQPRGDARRASR